MRTNMNNFNFDQFRSEFKKAVEQLETDFDIKINIGRITYDDMGFKTTMTATTNRDDLPSWFKSEWIRHYNEVLTYFPDLKGLLLKSKRVQFIGQSPRTLMFIGTNKSKQKFKYVFIDCDKSSTTKMVLIGLNQHSFDTWFMAGIAKTNKITKPIYNASLVSANENLLLNVTLISRELTETERNQEKQDLEAGKSVNVYKLALAFFEPDTNEIQTIYDVDKFPELYTEYLSINPAHTLPQPYDDKLISK